MIRPKENITLFPAQQVTTLNTIWAAAISFWKYVIIETRLKIICNFITIMAPMFLRELWIDRGFIIHVFSHTGIYSQFKFEQKHKKQNLLIGKDELKESICGQIFWKNILTKVVRRKQVFFRLTLNSSKMNFSTGIVSQICKNERTNKQ